MRRFLWVAGGLVWFGLLFVITFFLTFPRDAVIERARWEVAERSGGSYSLELGDLGPWWLGAAASDVKLYAVPRSGEPSLALLAKDLRVKTSLLSLLARAPRLSGSITPIEGTVYYTIGTARSEKKGDLRLNAVQVTSDGFPLSELLLLSGTDASGAGGLDIDIDVTGKDSLKSASGHVRLFGEDLTLSDVEIPGVGPLGMDVPIDELDIDIDVSKGLAKFKKGDIKSSLLTAELAGNVNLATTMERSTMNVEILLSDLGKELQAFAPMLSAAEVSPGSKTYKFTCSGTVGRPRCEMGAGRSSSRRDRSTRSASRPTRSTRASKRDTERPGRGERPDADELRKRREERLERLRKLREERAREVAGREERPEEEGDFDDPIDEELPYDEEEDGEFLDDEEFMEEDEEFFDEGE